MNNAFSFVHINNTVTPKHLGGEERPKVTFDKQYFEGKYVFLFDDIITSGKTMLLYKQKLESLGAIVVAGLSIGKTQRI